MIWNYNHTFIIGNNQIVIIVITMLSYSPTRPFYTLKFKLKNDNHYRAIWFDTFEESVIEYLTQHEIIIVLNKDKTYPKMYELELTTKTLLKML